MFKTSPLAAAAFVALLSAPAGAACLDEVAQLSERLNQLESAEAAEQQPGDGETVEMKMAGGREVEMTVDEAEGGTDPQESWFGESPPAPAGAEAELDNAREMAQAGDEQGCMAQAEQAAQIISAFEEQLQ